MNVLVTIQEVKVIERTYEVQGVNSLETAEKCAYRCIERKFQPNTYLYREIPHRPTYKTASYEVKEEN